MILPTKGIAPSQALLALGADVLSLLTEQMTVSRLWNDFRADGRHAHVSFDRFVLTLDLLFSLGVLEHRGGRLRRVVLSEEAS